MQALICSHYAVQPHCKSLRQILLFATLIFITLCTSSLDSVVVCCHCHSRSNLVGIAKGGIAREAQIVVACGGDDGGNDCSGYGQG